MNKGIFFSCRFPDDNSILFAKLILFIIFPIAPVLWSLADMRRRSSYVILFLYSALIGFCFTINESTGYDSLRYVDVFENISYTFYIDFANWITLSSSVHDFYLQTLAFVVSCFTTNYHYLFFSAAVIFSLFYLSSLRNITEQEEYKADLVSFCVLILFLLSNSIININGFRFWTAAWYVVWCSFNIILKDRKFFWILLLLSPFFHSSMIVYIVVMVAYRLTRNALNFWQALSIISVFVSSLSVLLFQSVEGYLPDALQTTIGFYTDKDYIISRGAGSGWSWLETLSNEAIKVFFVVSLIVVNKNRMKQVGLSRTQYQLLVFAFCILSFSNFTSSIPSLGNRYIHMVYPFVAYFLIKYSRIKQVSNLIYLIPVLLFFSILYTFVKMYLPLLPQGFFYSPLPALIF